MSDNILRTLKDDVLHLEISRREKKNALSTAMYAALSDALQQASGDRAVRVVLLRGQEDLFTAGNELGDFLQPQRAEDVAGIRFIQVLAAFDKPLVAAVAGNAVGIGTTMLLHCDLVYAADNASFRLPFVPLGLCPEACSSWLLPRLAGHQRAAELLYFGEPFDARRAYEIGLVNAVLAPAALLATATERAQKLARLPREALAVTRMLLKRPGKAQVDDAMAEEIRRFSELAAGPVAREVLGAFLEKREPDFSHLPDGRP